MAVNMIALKGAAANFDITHEVGLNGVSTLKSQSFQKSVARYGVFALTVVGVPLVIGLLVRDLVRLKARYQEAKFILEDKIHRDMPLYVSIHDFQINRKVDHYATYVQKFKEAQRKEATSGDNRVI